MVMLFSEQPSLSSLQLQHESSSGLLVNTPFLSIHNLRSWDGVNLEYYQALPGIIAQQSRQHLVLVFFSQGTVKQKFEGNTQSYTIAPGSIILIPTSVCCQISWFQPLDFAVLILKPSAIARANRELNLKSDRVALTSGFKQSDSLVYTLVATLLSEINFNKSLSCIYTETLFKTIAVHLFQRYAFPSIEATEKTEPLSKLDRAIAYIENNLDKNLRIAEIAAVANTSKYHFCRLFKRSTGISPYQYLLQQRIKRAKALLQFDSELSIADLSLRCGFANQSHLCKCFRKFTGLTPKAYRDRQLGFVAQKIKRT